MLSNFIRERIFRFLNIPKNAYEFWKAYLQLGYSQKLAIPKVIFRIGAFLFLRGILNNSIISRHLDWIWPYWVNRQFFPDSPDFSARGFSWMAINQTHRNWTAIGILGRKEEAIVDPRGLLTPVPFSWSLDIWVIIGDKIYSPSQFSHVTQYLHFNLPMVNTIFEVEGVKIKVEIYSETSNGEDLLFVKAVSENKTNVEKVLSIVFTIRPYNPEGISLIKNIEYLPNNKCFIVNDKLGVIFDEQPNNILCSNAEDGDIAKRYFNWTMIYKRSCKIGLSSGLAEYKFNLNPSEKKAHIAKIPAGEEKKLKSFLKKMLQPIERKKLKERIEKIRSIDFFEMKKNSVNRWKEKIKEGIELSIPDERMQAAWESNYAYLLLFFDGDVITPGPFTYHYFWFRDAAYSISALDKIGYSNDVNSIINTFPKRQRRNGFFESQEGEWDSNGQAIWTMMEHYRFTRDKNLLREIYPCIKRGAYWIRKMLVKKADPNSKLSGLMPYGLSAEHFGEVDYYYWDDYWALAGFKEAMNAADELGYIEDKRYFEECYFKLKKDLMGSIEKVSRERRISALPISPHRGLDSAAIGSLVSVYPLDIFNSKDPLVIETIKFLESNCFFKGSFFHDIAHSGYGTYLTLHLAQCYLKQRSDKVWWTLNWMLDHGTTTFTWPEAIHPNTGGGCMGDGHHGWMVADMLHLIRNLFFFEEKQRLILTPLYPKEWLKPNKRLTVKKAPTYFGNISFEVNCLGKEVELNIECPYTSSLREIEFNLPYDFEIKNIDGQIKSKEPKRAVFHPQVKKVLIELKK